MGNLNLTGQSAQFAAVLAQFSKWDGLLDARRPMYSDLPRDAQKDWRENPDDPVMFASWERLEYLAAFFGVEIQP